MKNYFKHHWYELVFTTVLMGLIVVAVSLIFGYSFSTNDDAMLRNIIEGTYTGTPDAHLVYIMYPLAFVWKCLYQWIPAFPWYDLFMVGMHYICWFMILFRIGQLFHGKIAKGIAIVIGVGGILVVDLPYLVMHQYTILAALMAAVAIFWLVTSKNVTGGVYWLDRTVCIIFLTLCLWLRNQVFLMAAPIGFLIVLYEIFQSRKCEEKGLSVYKRNFGFLGIILAVFVFSFLIEHFAYYSEEWKDFKAYNEARTDIYDFYGVPSYADNAARYEEIGISYGDWLVIDHYDSALVEELNTNQMIEIAGWSKDRWKEAQQYYSVSRQALYSIVDEVLYNDVQPIGLFLCIMYVVSLLICYQRNDKSGGLFIGTMLIYQAVFVGYFILQGRFPERVSYGLYFMQFACLTGYLIKDGMAKVTDVKKDKFWVITLLCSCIVLLGGFGLYQVRMTLNEKAETEQNAQDWIYLNEYMKDNEEATFCIITKSFVFSTENMFKEQNIEAANMIRLGSWVQNSPLEEAHNMNAGVIDIANAVAGQNACYIVQESGSDMEWMNCFWQENGYNVQASVIETIITPGGRSFDVIVME